MAELLNNEERTETGTKRMRRLRQAGFTPAVLYSEGGKASVALSIPTKQINVAVGHGSHIVKLEGKVNTDALIKDVQWDMLGRDVLHLDLTSIDLTEAITVTLPIELIGDAPGTKMGGVVKQLMKEIEIECPANVLPDKIEVRINSLELNQTITVGDLELPEGAKASGDDSDGIVQCAEPSAAATDEEADSEGAAAEPEVIGRKADEDAE